MVNTDYILCSQRWGSSIQSAKTRPGADCGSDHELLITKFRLILKKVGKTTRSFGYQFSSVAQSCPTLCDPMNRSTPGLPVHHQLPEFTQIQVHRVRDANQPSHPLSPLLLLPPIPPSIRVFSSESTLRMRGPKYWSFSFSIIPFKGIPGLISTEWMVGSPCSPRDSQESSPTPQFKSISSSVLSFLYSPL